MKEYFERLDARGIIGFGVYFLVLVIFAMIWTRPELVKDDFFKTIATLIVGTAYVNGMVSWAYSATKNGGELADKNAAIVEKQANANPPIADKDKEPE